MASGSLDFAAANHAAGNDVGRKGDSWLRQVLTCNFSLGPGSFLGDIALLQAAPMLSVKSQSTAALCSWCLALN